MTISLELYGEFEDFKKFQNKINPKYIKNYVDYTLQSKKFFKNCRLYTNIINLLACIFSIMYFLYLFYLHKEIQIICVQGIISLLITLASFLLFKYINDKNTKLRI